MIEAPVGYAVDECAPHTYDKSIGYARKNKLENLFSRVILPHALTGQRRDVQTGEAASIAQANAFVLHIIRTASDVLNTGGIEHFFFKGPLQQFQLYGDFFAKRSADADLLVKEHAFEKASNLLVKNGFFLPNEFRSLWWSQCLGERPLFKAGGRPSLDLHHRLQQPGCPPPRRLPRFFSQTESMRLGADIVQVANLPSIALIAAINLTKAIYHREACGNHAMDLCMALRRMTPDALLQLQAEAGRQGLKRTLGFAARASALTFGVSDLLGEGPYVLPMGANIVRGMIINPEEHLPYFPKRRNMLYYLCGGNKADFVKESCRLFFSEAVRATLK